mgnify:CR=1 FL=1
MSGGVDSSVAALLLKSAGNECIGCTMKLYSNEDAGISKGHTCCSLDDVEDARSVAYRLGMPYYVFNFSDDFREKVIDRFAAQYCMGMTPNPCIDCNRCMKFAKLFDRADILRCSHIATGHYVRIERSGEKYLLKKALDPSKDQSYVLYAMTQAQLARTLFPLGELNKRETRQLAERGGFINAQKPDSQDICFAPDGDYAKIIELHTGKKSESGDFVDAEGHVLGRHAGVIRYTIGQHRGLGLSLPEKRFVTAIDPVKNTVTLGAESELYRRDARAAEFNWISGETPDAPVRCRVKIRYRQTEQWAWVTPRGDSEAEILFDEPQRAITPGQAAVLYDGDTVLGGLTVYPKVIEKHLNAELPFMATENILMYCVRKGGDRQELHEAIRKHSVAAGLAVKQEGADNDLLERIAADPVFKLTREEIQGIISEGHFTGMAEEQTKEYLKAVRAVLDANRDVIAAEPAAEINI